MDEYSDQLAMYWVLFFSLMGGISIGIFLSIFIYDLGEKGWFTEQKSSPTASTRLRYWLSSSWRGLWGSSRVEASADTSTRAPARTEEIRRGLMSERYPCRKF